ncbi:MAG TPA: putative Ig domain-containing protein [Geodermatophilus sp.]|nr:putative Ig domain-containing protein [Geodermatophilus sp.]
MSRSRAFLAALTRILVVAVVVTGAVLTTSPASAAVTVSRAEVDRGNLRIEGRASVNRTITVDGVAMATSDSSGSFRVSRSSYTPPADCTVDVNDGSATPTTVRLNGCTVTASPPPPAVLPDTAELGPGRVGVQLGTTVVNLVNAIGPTSWAITAGALPDGLSLVVPEPGGRPRPPEQETYAEIRGTPTTVQTSTFTVRGTDANGLTATRTYTMRIDPALPLAITPQSWPPVAVGEHSNLWIDGSGGVRPYRWAVSAGALPPGMSLIQDAPDGPSVRVGGTPTTEGTFDWTLQLTDAQAGTVSRAFTVTVGPAPVPEPAPEPTPEPQPAPVFMSISSLALSPTSVTGGGTSTGTVTLSTAAPAEGTSVILASGNPQVATVPARVTVPAGSTSATFTVSTTAVGSSTNVGIEATYAGTLIANLTVNPAAPSGNVDTVSVTRAEYDSGKRQLRVEATSSGAGATLRVYVTATNALIGTLSGGSGQFSVSSNPQSITVRSSLGGSATRTVTVK